MTKWVEGAITETNFWEDGKYREIKDETGKPIFQIQLADDSSVEILNLILNAPKMLKEIKYISEAAKNLAESAVNYGDGGACEEFCNELPSDINELIKSIKGE